MNEMTRDMRATYNSKWALKHAHNGSDDSDMDSLMDFKLNDASSYHKSSKMNSSRSSVSRKARK